MAHGKIDKEYTDDFISGNFLSFSVMVFNQCSCGHAFD